MYFFEREQYIYNIAGVRIGGVRGETPTVLVGTIFYSGDKVVADHKKGLFDRDAARRQIEEQDRVSEVTGNPAMVQVFAESSAAMVRYIDFVSDATSSPFLIDSTDAQVRLDGLRHCQETGLLDRAVYNSINASVTDEEIRGLEETRPQSAIILAFNPHDSTIAGRRAVLEQPVSGRDKGLLELARELGVTKPLVDTATTAIGAGAGTSISFIMVAKTLYGQPTGSGVHNAPTSWPWLRAYKKTDRDAYEACDTASPLLVQAMGGDFVLYGPISNARRVFPVVAMADVFAAESASMEFGLTPEENHPFRKLL
ncbi:MAG: tetrahydromethanopterin S-methyltransferase subunit H [Candidatus Thorarchaeota archaeon]|nr:tetrahydromethanopterin S-methyltransferase subunit H [Candidatus Thorarchaeota archaeon]